MSNEKSETAADIVAEAVRVERLLMAEDTACRLCRRETGAAFALTGEGVRE